MWALDSGIVRDGSLNQYLAVCVGQVISRLMEQSRFIVSVCYCH